MKKAFSRQSSAIRLLFFLVFLLITITYNLQPSLAIDLTDPYPCGAPDQIQVGTAQGECEINGQTCTAFSHYLYTDENTQAWCDNDNCAEPCNIPTPSPTLTPFPTSKVATPSSEEKAVYTLNQGLLPRQLAEEQEPQLNIFQNIFKGIQNLFGGLFLFNIVNKPKMYTQSADLDKSTVPPELLPKTDNYNQNMTDYLGGSAGVYGVNLPAPIQDSKIPKSEESYEKANFPEGINPVTGQK
ncbi:MAG: hypothetical protein Q7R97_01325 [Candidatus Daviesbacteria bacterium]|nr:hypothetical protein [Candidatus Daviesbacteria bacterium]